VPNDALLVLRFTVPGKPCTQGSKDQFGREANRRLPGWRSDARQAALAAAPVGWDPAAPVLVAFTAFFARPRSHYGSRRGEPYLRPDAPPYPGRVGDVDKIARALLDALTGILWNDDDQVIDLHGRKLYAAIGVAPSTFVTVTRVDPE
jgi:Holliday junction resolvase RusA-like endonuclease